MVEQLNCPFCGSDDNCGSCDEDGNRFLQCLHCGAKGPDARTVDGAVALWKRRAPLQTEGE